MAYSRSRRSSSRRPARRSYSRRRTTRRTSRRSAPQKVVIQVIGGPGGYVPISATSGKKGRRILRRKH